MNGTEGIAIFHFAQQPVDECNGDATKIEDQEVKSRLLVGLYDPVCDNSYYVKIEDLDSLKP